VVHATHANERELDLVAESGSAICLCPSTEANLGDGFFPALAIRQRAIRVCIGSDSNVRLDPFEELREIEWVARRQKQRRGIFEPEALLHFGSGEGAAALGLERVAPIEVEVAAAVDDASLVFSSGPEAVR
jgi:formimidoylglutamate deiminase